LKNLDWLASYPKSGNTWTRAFLAAYASNASAPMSLSQISRVSNSESRLSLYCKQAKKSREQLIEIEIDSLREAVQAELAQSKRPRTVIKTHNARIEQNGYPLIRPEYTRSAVYIVRNPLDIVDSLADHSNLTLDQSVALMNSRSHQIGGGDSGFVKQYLDSWSQHVESWLSAKEFPVFFLKYEDLKQFPIEGFKQIIQFLGWEFDQDRLERAVKWSDFKVLQSSETQTGFPETSRIATSQKFFRHGTTDRWKQVLSDSQIESIIQHHAGTMFKLGYTA
jgi:Sulfotransferase domain